jgi:Hemolysins and related proteins containing CBS domains
VVEFGDRLVREIMTPRARMVAVDKNTSIGQLKEIFSKEKYSRMPVYRERLDNIEGMVIAKDLLEFSSPDRRSEKLIFYKTGSICPGNHGC